MAYPATSGSAVTVRAATLADLPAIATLLIQLYEAELPGGLRGPRKGQQRLLEFTLRAKQAQGLRGRYVARDDEGLIVGTAAMDLPGGPRYERAPAGTVSQAVRLIGVLATARLLLTVARSMVTPGQPPLPQTAFIHSVAVDLPHRGQGVGRALMLELERLAAAQGAQACALQVLATNRPARRLYAHLGYTDIWASPRWARALTWPSFLMRKALAQPGLEG